MGSGEPLPPSGDPHLTREQGQLYAGTGLASDLRALKAVVHRLRGYIPVTAGFSAARCRICRRMTALEMLGM